MSESDSFFDEAEERSIIKGEIVSKYFGAWANVMKGNAKKRNGKLVYLDLFCGRGRYGDGTESIPIKILEHAINHKDLRKLLVTYFNDSEQKSVDILRSEIENIDGIELLTHKPQVECEVVGDDLAKLFEKNKLHPTLMFADPFGYKGLSLRLIKSVLKDWGCDCIFFFNYNRINPGISNEGVRSHMEALFEPDRLDALRQKLSGLSPYEREKTIINAFSEALKEQGGIYDLHYKFKNKSGTRTSHLLIYVTKSKRGHDIMKSIMAKASTTIENGVPTFEFNQAKKQQKSLFGRLDDLAEELLEIFSGQILTMQQIFDQHNVGKPYIESNYKEAPKNLESEGEITVIPPAVERAPGTFGDNVKVDFT